MDGCEQLYRERLDRYTTAMRNEQPDRVPIRPFVAEFTGTYAGYTCQELAHDYENAFAAARRCATDFPWDAVVPNMLATWTGMTQAMGLRYYMTPGIDLPPDVGHQYYEPPPEQAWMNPGEYDALIADPTGFLYNVWFPRVSEPLSPIGGPVTFAHNLTLIRGAMAMMRFFQAWGVQEQRLRPVHQLRPFPEHLLADPQADRARTLGAWTSDALLRRGELGSPLGCVRGVARTKHRLSHRSGRRPPSPAGAGGSVLPERRTVQLLARLSNAGRSASGVQAVDSIGRPRGWIYHGRVGDHPARRESGKHPRDDRGDVGIRRLLPRPHPLRCTARRVSADRIGGDAR